MTFNLSLVVLVADTEEQKVKASKLQVYVRPWWPSKYLVGPLREVVLDKHTVADLKEKVTTKSW